MMSKIDRKSLKFKLWQYFVAFAVAILVMLWLLQTVFLNSYYKTMKANEIKKIGNRIVELYGTEEFEKTLIEVSFTEGISISILDQDGKLIYPLDLFDLLRQPRLNEGTFNEFLSKLFKSGNDYVVYTRTDERVRDPVLIYGAILKNPSGSNYFLFINSMLEPIDSTITVLKSQLLIITFISIVMSMAISVLLARRLSKPIIRITDSARLLSGGDYDVRFDNGSYTEVDNLATALNTTTKELKQTEELRRDLIANVTHDLKTPLTVIKSYSELIRDISGEDSIKRDEHIETIIEEADRLSSLVDDMLEMTRLQSGAYKLEIKTTDLYKTTAEVLDRFKIYEEQDGFTFLLTGGGDTDAEFDSKRISQAIYNLILNAINFSEDSREIEVSVNEIKGGVVLSVKDHGVGISEENLPHIWDKYFKVGKSHSREKSGSGVGLSIVKAIIEAHKGAYGVESEIGNGSRFHFTLYK